MKTVKQLVQGMLVVVGVIGLAAGASAAPKSISKCQTIDNPGSYLLTRNLTVNGDCLVVEASDVTIDLGGYVLSGNGTGSGVVDVTGNASVRNGTVTGFQGGIVLSGPGGIVDQVRAHGNFVGIYVSAGGSVKASVTNNNEYGIQLLCPSSAFGNTALDNPSGNLVTFLAGCLLSQNLAP